LDFVSEDLAGLHLLDPTGHEHELRSGWREHTAVLGFLRHFG